MLPICACDDVPMTTGVNGDVSDQGPNGFQLAEGTDFTRPIFGSGNATVVSSLMRGFAGRVALVGVTSEPNHVLDRWTTIEVYGNIYT